MSDNGETQEAAPVVPSGQLSLEDALAQVLRDSLHAPEANGETNVVRGLRECARALDRVQGVADMNYLCILFEGCTEEAYRKLITALCQANNIHLINVPDAKKLGEMVGLCKLDRDGKPRKVVSTSCVVVRNLNQLNSSALPALRSFIDST